MSAVEACRTSVLGGHVDECDSCGHIRVSYNSCRNRHCRKSQGLTKVRTNINIAPTTSVRISCNQKRICITLRSIIIVGKRALNALKVPWAISPVIGFPPEALITQEKIYDKPIQPKTNAIKGIYTCSVPDMDHNGMCQPAHTRPNIIFPTQRPYFVSRKGNI